MHRLFYLFVGALLAFVVSVQSYGAGVYWKRAVKEKFAQNYVNHQGGAQTQEAQPTIYLFGETHETLAAERQLERIDEHRQANRIMRACEGFAFDRETIDTGLLGQRNKIGSENALMYALNGFFAALAFYGDIQVRENGMQQIQRKMAGLEKLIEEMPTKSNSLLKDNLYSMGTSLKERLQKSQVEFIHRKVEYKQYAEGAIASSLYGLLSPDSGPLLTYLNSRRSDSKLREHLFFRTILEIDGLLNSMDRPSTLNMRQMGATSLQECFLEYSLKEQIQFLTLLTSNLLAYLRTLQLPDGNAVAPEIIKACNDAINYDWLNSHDIHSMPKGTIEPLGRLRDVYIADNLETLYPIAAARGLLLTAIYGHDHLTSLKAKLEAKGFSVITDDMAALETAIA
ncbi:MAG TPA: hypothetical protein PLV25_06945, partial [Opitutales bacterium]|nr:hypothetical protein [Opitutales bacterium]